jgi:hypothetical protein
MNAPPKTAMTLFSKSYASSLLSRSRRAQAIRQCAIISGDESEAIPFSSLLFARIFEGTCTINLRDHENAAKKKSDGEQKHSTDTRALAAEVRKQTERGSVNGGNWSAEGRDVTNRRPKGFTYDGIGSSEKAIEQITTPNLSSPDTKTCKTIPPSVKKEG